MNPIMFIIIANICFILGIALLFYSTWLDSFRPDWFYIFNIFENDFFNYKEYKLFLPLKGNKDRYDIDKVEYDKSNSRPYINSKGVYTWNFEKGKNRPVYFDNTKPNIDGNLIAESKKLSLDDIWFGGNAIDDFLKTYGWVIAIVIMIVIVIVMSQNQAKTTEMLINATLSRT